MTVAYLSILRNGRAEEGVLFLAVEDLVHKVASFERLELLLVRRSPIIVFSYRLISPAILNISSVHRGRNRSRLTADCQIVLNSKRGAGGYSR